jgi:hypothetical protein
MCRIASVFLTVLVLTACGGGSGGDGGTPAPPPSAPGTLRTLAVEGQPAPGTNGVFLALPQYPIMDAADGGFCAFVAPTDDSGIPAKTEVLYVVQPDAVPTLVEVFAVGDDVPGPSDGTIDGFGSAWMGADGTVLAFVSITGDSFGSTFAVISALVAGGAATAKTDVLYDGDDLTAAGGVATLEGVDIDSACTASDNTFWFLGQDGVGGPVGLWSVESSGAGLTAHALVGDSLSDFASVTSIDAFGIDDAGSIYCFVATADIGATRRMVVHTTVGSTLNLEFFRTGDVMPSGIGTVLEPHKGGRIIVYGGGEVVWVAQGNQGGIDDVLMYFDPIPAPSSYAELVRSGDPARDTANGQHAAIDMLTVAKSCLFPQFEATVLGSGSGVTQGTFGVFDLAGNHTLDSSNLVVSGGSVVPATTIDLRNVAQRYTEASADGSFAFAQAFSGTSALFWLVRGTGTFAVAAEGGPAPDGDTFEPFEPSSAHTVADGTVLFRAELTTGGSAILRQGP